MRDEHLQPGEMFVSYRIVRLLGEGGMGAVYEAEHEFTRRRVALKVIHTSRSNRADFQARHVQEAQILADLNHENVVRLYDANITKDGTVWMATEYLEGETLRDLLTRFRIQPRDALRYLIEACDGVAAAHEVGIVHRDLKPENIFWTRQGKIKVLDFGAAKARDRDLVNSTEMVLAGGSRQIIGTPGYMSPEHLGGFTVDERTDVYALGTIGYELFIQHPLNNDDGSKPEVIELCRRQIEKVPRPLSEAAPHLPLALTPIFQRAMQKNANDRYRRVADLVADLRAVSRDSENLLSAPRAPFSPRWVAAGSYQAHGPKFTLPEHEPVVLPSKQVVVDPALGPVEVGEAPVGRSPLGGPMPPTAAPRFGGAPPPTAAPRFGGAPPPTGGPQVPLGAPVPAPATPKLAALSENPTVSLGPVSPGAARGAPLSSVRLPDSPRSFDTPVFGKTEVLHVPAEKAEAGRHTTMPITVQRAEQTERRRSRSRVWGLMIAGLVVGGGAAAVVATRGASGEGGAIAADAPNPVGDAKPTGPGTSTISAIPPGPSGDAPPTGPGTSTASAVPPGPAGGASPSAPGGSSTSSSPNPAVSSSAEAVPSGTTSAASVAPPARVGGVSRTPTPKTPAAAPGSGQKVPAKQTLPFGPKTEQ